MWRSLSQHGHYPRENPVSCSSDGVKLTVSEVESRCSNVFGAGELIPRGFSELMLSAEGHELGMPV